MAFHDFPEQHSGVELLQRSMERGRLGHGYLFSGADLEVLEGLSRTLAKVLNCERPVTAPGGRAIDSCDQCLTCRKVESANHPDVLWVRPESKTRVIQIDQIRELSREMNLKPCEARRKVAVVVAADRLNVQSANAFLKTLEEPPASAVLILLTTEPQRLLETILSRCLRVNFGSTGHRLAPQEQVWLAEFSRLAGAPAKSLLGRYRLLDHLLQRLNALKEEIELQLTEKSPLERYADAEKDLREKWEAELAAAVEAEYRHQRSRLVLCLQLWLRDVWVQTITPAPAAGTLLVFPELAETRAVGGRLKPNQAEENLRQLELLQSQLGTNVQEALALEVSLLKLHL